MPNQHLPRAKFVIVCGQQPDHGFRRTHYIRIRLHGDERCLVVLLASCLAIPAVAVAAGPADNRSVRVRNALSRTGRWIWSVRRLMLLSGALPVLSFPAANLEWLAWFGLVPGFVLIVRAPSAPGGGGGGLGAGGGGAV